MDLIVKFGTHFHPLVVKLEVVDQDELGDVHCVQVVSEDSARAQVFSSSSGSDVVLNVNQSTSEQTTYPIVGAFLLSSRRITRHVKLAIIYDSIHILNGQHSLSVAPPSDLRSLTAPAPGSPAPLARTVPLAVSFEGRRLAKPQLSCFRRLCGLLDQLQTRHSRRKA
ncbi:hypothetical protein KIN20_026233 [Parelaphostrongylus tenuis]|uniref:Uncharacterized protein n=1 Tax=Parelaphostrongylus tenuis TaxID=148309 RepID=A0AAD5NA35_PARTN|nr:hypothetical protein KIN20_026233 [Parelaphostrongylus tenuis]